MHFVIFLLNFDEILSEFRDTKRLQVEDRPGSFFPVGVFRFPVFFFFSQCDPKDSTGKVSTLF
jgi:hypothetical protein